ncbi:T-cell surface antigen CD2-like [Echeneis naucrates]|uniref:T-cell surface antigen CD2-like n=1 Tax=Echeneis naucrates TaxID=173247 RepID=A0A665W3K6_ECHNA|nr:T-cell surface antigen CD2-like [Echeneis naucrates]
MMRRMRTMIYKITLLLLCCSIISSKASKNDCESYVAEGSNFLVKAGQPVKKTHRLRWMHNNAIILDRRLSKGDTPAGFNKGNAKDLDENGWLKLTNLTKSQAGLYAPEAYDSDGKKVPNLKSTSLCVVEPVPEPKVTFLCDRGKDKIELTCNTAKGLEGVQFAWLQNNKALSQKTKVLSLGVKNLGTSSFACKITKNSISVTSKAVTAACSTNTGSVFPQEILGVSIWIFVGCGGVIVLLLIIFTIVCCIRARKKHSRLSKDEEELRLGWTNPQQEQREFHQQSHHPHHQHHHQHQHHQHQQQHPAGHTGPRQNRTKRPRAPDPTNGRPQPSPRAAPQVPKPADGDEEQPPPLPQPRKKVPKTPRM